jgi:hypothetical protein
MAKGKARASQRRSGGGGGGRNTSNGKDSLAANNTDMMISEDYTIADSFTMGSLLNDDFSGTELHLCTSLSKGRENDWCFVLTTTMLLLYRYLSCACCENRGRGGLRYG